MEKWLQKLSFSPRRLLGLFLGLVCLITVLLYSKLSRESEVDIPAVTEDLTAINPDTVSHTYLPSVNVTINPPVDPSTNRANATLVMLARNSDIDGVESSMRSLEKQFNHRYNYSWIFLNEVPFSDEFKSQVANLTNGEVKFGLVPHDHWFQPEWIDDERMRKGMEELEKYSKPWPIPYANSTSYRNMCRFNSGFFFRHELLDPYKWYWRVEPDVQFTCEIPFDPFVRMIELNKRYSFTISLGEVKPTIPSLWSTIKDFRATYPDLVVEDNAMGFLSNNDGETYNLCHFWSNFEIADLDFFRSDHYRTFFEFLDETGNFYYERWGDAPVHSIAVALFLPKHQIHFFSEIGYHHPPYQHCPEGSTHTEQSCECGNPLRETLRAQKQKFRQGYIVR